mgnify:CR=1 FL=1
MGNNTDKTIQETEELKKAMETILGRQVFMPQILIARDFIKNRWKHDTFKEYHMLRSYVQI